MTNEAQNTLLKTVATQAHCKPDQPALTFVHIDKGGDYRSESRSYSVLLNNGTRLATALLSAEMNPADRFALYMHNHPEFVEAMLGAEITDTIFVPVDARVRGEKLKYMLEFSGCRGIIAADYTLPVLEQIFSELPSLEWIWVIDTGATHQTNSEIAAKSTPYDAILKGSLPISESVIGSSHDQVMQLLFTSGTTGNPKAVEITRFRYGSNMTQATHLGLLPDDRPYTGLSLTHTNAQMLTLGMGLYLGLEVIISRKFTKSHFWDIIRHYECTIFTLLGGMTTAIYSEPPSPRDKEHKVRYVISAGMPKPIWKDFKTRFGVEILEIYGSTEGGTTLNPPNTGPIGSIGKPLPHQIVEVIDNDGRICAPGEPGEIVFRNINGTCPDVQYFNNPEASNLKTQNGWLHMGDIGYKDKNGWLFFEYRVGGGIRRNGDFVNPAFVEKELSELDYVDDCYVYGVALEGNAPGEKEVVAALVIHDAHRFVAEEVFRYCREKLEANIVPSFIQILPNIPKTASEKPIEKDLIEDFFGGRKSGLFKSDSF